MLPLPVLEKAASELVCYGDAGMSVMEMSHRSPAFEEIIAAAEKGLRDLMNIPDNYKVLFMQGGASTQFAMIPLNLIFLYFPQLHSQSFCGPNILSQNRPSLSGLSVL